MVQAALPHLLDLPYLGSKYDPKKKERESLPIDSNETPSTIPSLFYDATRTGRSHESVQQLFRRVFPTLTSKYDVALIRQIKSDIQDHVEDRMGLFWQQLLMALLTHIQFSYSEKAIAQAGFINKESTAIPLAEAHDATLPCLLFCKTKTWYVFGEDSSFFHAQNMTKRLPKSVNEADTWIDRTKKQFGSSFREESITLIQDAAFGKKDLKEAFQSFTNLFFVRVAAYEKSTETDIDPSQKSEIGRLYAEVATSYKTQAAKDDTLFKRLCLDYKTQGAVTGRFFLKVQIQLHRQLIADMKIQERLQQFVLCKPLSNTQHSYSKIYLNSPELTQLLATYFKTTPQQTLVSDWTKVAQITLSKAAGLSDPLQKIIQQSVSLITTIYDLTSPPQKVGFIVERMLFNASLTLSPDTTTLYTFSEENRRVSTRRTKKPAAHGDAPAELTKMQKEYVRDFKKSAEVSTLLKLYHANSPPHAVKKDIQNAKHITFSKKGNISEPLGEIVDKCIRLSPKKIQKFGFIISHMLQEGSNKEEEKREAE